MDQNMDHESLYNQGMQAFRSARWADAIAAFTAIEAHFGPSPETDRLLSEAQLKIGIDRAEMPMGNLQPKKKPWLLILSGLGGFAIVAAIAAAAIAMGQPAPPEQPSIAADIGFPTVAPTNTPTPQPTATPQPTPTGPGTLQVRWASDQAAGAHAIKHIEIILDASGSMLGTSDGVRRIDTAHQALAAMVQQLPGDTQVALRTYGRQRSNDCTDTELVQPFAPLDQQQLIAQIQKIIPVVRAKTPLARSLQQVVSDTQRIDSDVMVLVVSDGDETCDGDPVQVAQQIHAGSSQIRISVIGFHVEPEEWRARLRAIADQGGGSYFDAADTQQLTDALRNAVKPQFHVFGPESEPLFSGEVGQSVQLAQGSYRVQIDGIATPIEGLDVQNGGSTVLEVSDSAGKLQIATATPQS